MDALLEVLVNNNCYVQRGEKGCKEFLTEKLQDYIENLKEALIYENNPVLGVEGCDLVRKHVGTVEEEIQNILKVFSLYNSGQVYDAYSVAFELFDKMEPYMVKRYLYNSYDKTAFRIRSIDNTFKKNSRELFHIPFSKRHLVKNERYSLAGHPCLYLATQIGLAWCECNRPEKFAVSKYVMPNDEMFYVVDFSTKNIPEMHQIHCDLMNQTISRGQILEKLNSLLCIYPLRFACSIPVEKVNGDFKEEYILSQMLLQWIIRKENVDGVIYETCKPDAWAYGGYNIALPTKSYDDNGYDNKLKRTLKISKPEIISAKIDENMLWGITFSGLHRLK